MMQYKLVQDLKRAFPENDFSETQLNDTQLYVSENEKVGEDSYTIKYTCLSNEEPSNRHFKILNSQQDNTIGHICIDGDFIPYGQPKYNVKSNDYSDKRPDSIVYDLNKFVFLELKLEQEDLTWGKEDPKWKKFFEGARQILDFATFLRKSDIEIKSYYTEIQAVICFRFEPNFSIISNGNAQRNKELFKISKQLGFEILSHDHSKQFVF